MDMNIIRTKVSLLVSKLIKDKKGATMVEYAIMLFLILVIAAAIYKSLGSSVSGAGSSAINQFNH
jgi:Flp pilus assembly pilin Flp